MGGIAHSEQVKWRYYRGVHGCVRLTCRIAGQTSYEILPGLRWGGGGVPSLCVAVVV